MRRKLFLSFLITLVLAGCGPSASDLGPFAPSRNRYILGQDGVTPIPLSDSLTLWTFGDTILGEWKKDVPEDAPFASKVEMKTMISNSLGYTPAVSEHNIRELPFTFLTAKGTAAQVIKHHRHENPMKIRHWAFDGIRIKDRVYVYYVTIKINNPKRALDFSVESIGLSRWDIPKGWQPGDPVLFKRLGPLFTGGPPTFGATAVDHRGFLYLLGQYTTAAKQSPVKVARVRLERLEDPRAYRFLTKTGKWIQDHTKADGFINEIAGECSITYDSYRKRFRIVYSQLFSGKIMKVEFRNFSELKDAEKECIYTPPPVKVTDPSHAPWYYSGKEIAQFGKTIYVIYIHPVEYQPYLVKVKL